MMFLVCSYICIIWGLSGGTWKKCLVPSLKLTARRPPWEKDKYINSKVPLGILCVCVSLPSVKPFEVRLYFEYVFFGLRFFSKSKGFGVLLVGTSNASLSCQFCLLFCLDHHFCCCLVPHYCRWMPSSSTNLSNDVMSGHTSPITLSVRVLSSSLTK